MAVSHLISPLLKLNWFYPSIQSRHSSSRALLIFVCCLIVTRFPPILKKVSRGKVNLLYLQYFRVIYEQRSISGCCSSKDQHHKKAHSKPLPIAAIQN